MENPALAMISAGNIVQYPTKKSTAVIKTDGMIAFVFVEIISPITRAASTKIKETKNFKRGRWSF